MSAGNDGGPGLLPVEIRSNNFYAKWYLTPEKLKDFMAFACDCILEADRDAKEEAQRAQSGGPK